VRSRGSARGAGAGRGCAGDKSADCSGDVVAVLDPQAIVAGGVPHSAAEEFTVFRGGTDQRMILRERQRKLWRRFNLLERLFEQPLDGRTHVLVTVDAVADGVEFDRPTGVVFVVKVCT
jgi:hypothetical protein